MKTAVSIPDAIFRAADVLAKRKGWSRSELYARAIAELLRNDDEAKVTAQLCRVYQTDNPALDTTLSRLPAAVLDREEW